MQIQGRVCRAFVRREGNPARLMCCRRIPIMDHIATSEPVITGAFPCSASSVTVGAHYGELFQGQIEGARLSSSRCLLSLPCSRLYSRVTFMPNITGVVRVDPKYKVKSKLAAELTLRELGAGGLGGILSITSNIQESKGNGSSTSDCVGACQAAAMAIGCSIAPERVARLVVAAEQASDNTMFKHAVLFAQREGVVLEDYGRALPETEVLGFDMDITGYVDTLECPLV